MHFETQGFHECCDISCVKYLQQRTEDGTLRNSRSHFPRRRSRTTEAYSIGASSDEGCEPIVSYAVLYRSVLHSSVMYCTVLCCTALYYTVPYCTELHPTALYCIAIYCHSCSVQNFTTCTVLIVPCGVVSCRILYLTVLCCTILCCANCNFLLTYCTHSSVFSVVLSRLALHCNGMNNKVLVPCTQLIIMC